MANSAVVKPEEEPTAVDIESSEYFDNRVDRDMAGVGPVDDVEVFFTGFQAVEDRVEELAAILKLVLEEAEVTAVEFDPEAFPL